MSRTNETHDPSLVSWVESANASAADFPIQNLPFGVFRRRGTAEPFRGGVAIGDQIVDLAAAAATGVFDGEAALGAKACTESTLNAFMGMGARVHSAVRQALSHALRKGAAAQKTLASCVLPQQEAELALPARIGDYTDFCTSIHHATAIGRMFRPDNPLLANYKWVPIGYHGRSSTIGVSGQSFRRPRGQIPGGRKPVHLANGEVRTFLEDGDSVIMRGWCERSGFARIGFGSVGGRVVEAGD